MKKVQVIWIFLFCTFYMQSQIKIKGEFIKDKEDKKQYKWAILYALETGKEIYITNDDTIKNDTFEFSIPKNAKKGMYRILYQLKPEKKFLDVLVDKESFSVSFDPKYPQETALFTGSLVNTLYLDYLQQNYQKQNFINSILGNHFKEPMSLNQVLYRNGLKKIKEVATLYQKKSKGTIAYDFIVASQSYNNEKLVKTPKEYLKNMRRNFFKNIDFNNFNLFHSSFLDQRLYEYIIQINVSNNYGTTQELQTNAVKKVFNMKMKPLVKQRLLQIFIAEFVKLKAADIVQILFDDFYNKLPEKLQKQGFEKRMRKQIRIAVGNIAPEIIWKEKGHTLKLSQLNNHKKTLLIFWSTKCPHCIEQIPKVHKKYRHRKDFQVVTISLEEDDKEWKKITQTLQGWHHVLGLQQWENKIAKTYNIHSTPSFILLDKNKQILCTPKDFDDIQKLLK